MQRKENSAFTLIELLVVIAIIAILSAILFPVFASARDKGRQIACISNEKQIGLAVLQYMQDNDTRVPMVDYVDPSTNDQMTWTAEIQPYIKSWGVFTCPSDIHPVPTAYQLFSGLITYNTQGFDSSYAINADYMNPDPDCNSQYELSPGNSNGQQGTDGHEGIPIQENQMESPSRTVFAVDAKPLMTGNGSIAWGYRHWTCSPASMAHYFGLGQACGSWPWGIGYNGGHGWNFNQHDVGSYSPGDYGVSGDEQGPTATDRTSTRHNGGTDVIFCDGHVKWMTPGNLAAGSNWNTSILSYQIYITDPTQYLWSLKKSASANCEIGSGYNDGC